MRGRCRAGRRSGRRACVPRIPSPASRSGWRSPPHAELLLLHRGSELRCGKTCSASAGCRCPSRTATSATKLTLLASLAGRQSNLGVTDTRLRGGDGKEGVARPRRYRIRRVISSLAIETTTHPALIPQEVAGTSRQYPLNPATRRSESPGVAGNPRLIPVQPASGKTGLSRRRSRVRVPSLPLKSLQIGIMRCPFRRRIWSDYTDFRSRRPETAKTARNPSWDYDFKPIPTKLRPTRKAACDYTKTPEVNAARASSVVEAARLAPPWHQRFSHRPPRALVRRKGSSWSGRVRVPEDVPAKARTMGWRSLPLRRSSPRIC